MASLKRYKQPSENNSNRFQDIPPRFKRQKSFSSPNYPATMESFNQKNKKSWGDTPASTSSLPHHKGSFPREGRKIVKKLSPQKVQLNIENAAALKAPSQPFVLSPMENKLFNLMRNDDGCEESFSNVEHVFDHSTVRSPNQLVVPNCNSASIDLNNHSLPCHLVSANHGGWFENSPTNKQFHAKGHQQPSSNVTFGNSAVNSEEGKIDYSDPDIRTIEMLRELERVADQTDVGNDENSNDKNSLVSHHLRMLMCAVDRYTQGVDDELGSDSGEDEVPHKEAPLSPPEMRNTKISQHHDYVKENDFQNQNTSTCHQIHPLKHRSANHQQFPTENRLNTWNPWSTPSFNALDVYASLPKIDNSSNLNDPSMFFIDHCNQFCARDSCY